MMGHGEVDLYVLDLDWVVQIFKPLPPIMKRTLALSGTELCGTSRP